MAYWYTYAATESDTESDNELTEKDYIKLRNKMEKISNEETDFFNALGEIPYLYQFDVHLHPNVKYWLDAPQYYNALDHFSDIVDQPTLEYIKSGLEDYRQTDDRAYGETSWNKQQLSTIFEYAAGWVELHEMGINDYVNDVCWIASKIIRFQLDDHRLKHPFKFN